MYTPLKEKDLEKQLKAIPKEKWNLLFAAVEALKKSKAFGKMDETKQIGKNLITFPSYEISKEVNQLVKACYEIPIMVDFDWMAWDEGATLLNNPKTDFSTLSLETLVKLVTAIIRNDRFHEGYLLCKLEDGSLLCIINEIIKRTSK